MGIVVGCSGPLCTRYTLQVFRHSPRLHITHLKKRHIEVEIIQEQWHTGTATATQPLPIHRGNSKSSVTAKALGHAKPLASSFGVDVPPKPLNATMQTQQSQVSPPAAAAPATICEPPPPSVSLGHHPSPQHHLPAWPDAPPPPAPPSSLADGGGASTASPRRSADAAGD
nr:actin cytoskeleton-regulatory complex protein PAN1-like [Penaeus vannamei]